MTKKLHSLLEMAIVIGGLAAAPFAVIASLAPITATASGEHEVVAAAENVAGPAGLKF